jgi:hypothetical protein
LRSPKAAGLRAAHADLSALDEWSHDGLRMRCPRGRRRSGTKRGKLPSLLRAALTADDLTRHL